ncbi:MAG: hypothetical protein Q7J28_02615 [Caulobacter sp.]|nr:hypothetical protein [Caulobacter sp.]
MTAARVIYSAPPAASVPGPEPVGSDRVEIGDTARLRFDEVRGRVARISSTMLSRTATRAAVEQADAMLAEIEQQAKAARIALARGR